MFVVDQAITGLRQSHKEMFKSHWKHSTAMYRVFFIINILLSFVSVVPFFLVFRPHFFFVTVFIGMQIKLSCCLIHSCTFYSINVCIKA